MSVSRLDRRHRPGRPRRSGVVGATAAGGGGAPAVDWTLIMDASDTSSITATGNDVTSVADLSDRGYTYVAGGVPKTGTRTINGLNVIDFGGGGTSLYRSAPQVLNHADTGAWHIFVVCMFDTLTSIKGIVGGDNGGFGGSRVGQFLRHNTTTLESLGFNDGGGAGSDSVGTLATATPYILESRNTGTSLDALINGVSNGVTAVTSQNSLTASTSIANCWQGAGTAAPPTNGMDGVVGEVRFAPDALDTATADAWRASLAAKWGITL